MVAFRMNPYDVLDVTYEANEKDIQRVFRKKSLLLHPDKVTDDVERAKEAFELLKDAASLLQDETKRQRLDETVRSARSLALKELGLSMRMDQLEIEKEQAPGGKLHDIVPSFSDRIKRCTKQLMLDDELEKRRSIRLKQEAEFEARRQRDQAEEVLKRKAEVEQEWESSRENRVQGWRSFQKGSSKKKKKHTNVLG
ncbi:hypothetical protein MVES_003151 [Malassezia vespertilionis]|uniref:J domain-containing protein n=2 Tax=Malassezia vespertilionis TaxID=2020962 RepID=A0A2N1J879_9BASI|nr:hypothetical protein MVES_003151 [Malassezia vespertilionis]